jgi:hypothetical protein
MINLNQVPIVALAYFTCLSIAGCAGTTSTESAARTGALIGGLSDGWEGAATGAILGGVLGYAIDSSEDKKKKAQQVQREQAYREKAQRMEADQLARMRESAITEDPKTAYRPTQTNQLVGSTWRIVSLVDDIEQTPDFKSWIISFPSNNRATTLVMWDDGKVESYVESYSITADALILSGTYQDEPYITNAKFNIQNKQMVVVTPEARIVLEEIEENTLSGG